ncbi:transcriptional regulator [Ruegeria arenilitoris]|uniref:transcriptional regulator n=1 Tax=Ruegeria arenilitoris TaxID=1173585 RepID=UPI001480B29C|nr:transcriptional regulator [Ruegeria arenilitoris]
MTIVRTPTEYHAALREIEYLWGSEPDTEEGKRLKEYLAAVDHYERISKVTPDVRAIA